MSTVQGRSLRNGRVLSNDEVQKAAIKSAVQRCRESLETGVEQRLAQLGVFRDGKRTALDLVADQWSAQRDRPGVDAALSRWEQQGFDAAGAVEHFIRETSYTWLNRLAAISALEVRGLIRPIATLDASNRPAIIASLAPVAGVLLQAREVAETLLWQGVFAELATQLGTLFDPQDPHGFFPGSSAVLGALQALSQLDDATWREDDTPGWFYQFFTTKDERAALRKKKGAAFTSDDLGPINQFYTPAWVVRFLVDNTLGTLWRRMHSETAIGVFCTLQLPATLDETPLPPKRVRDIKIIDPACGAMHFGVYAFDVLRRMYDEEGLEPAREVPRLILERNLAGIDIDRRAIQIAALNLYLKAATVLREVGEPDPPRDLRINLGCADAPPPSGEQQAQLRAKISDPALRQAVDVAVTSLTYLHAVGSLLDVAADVRAALTKKTPPLPPGHSPLPGLLAQVGIVETAEPSALDALVRRARELAEESLRADDVSGALAAEDALLAAKVLGLVNERYDVVLMNPPYGELMPPLTKQYLHQRYPQSKSDIYGAFFELAFRLAEGGGAVGALTSKTYLYLDTFKHVRKLLLETGRLSALIDAGTGILFESFVPVGASVSWSLPPMASSRALVLRVVHSTVPETAIEEVVDRLRNEPETEHKTLYRPRLADLRKLPTATIAYWAPPALFAAYQKYPALDPTYGEVRVGLQTGDDDRFLRFWWEVPEEEIGQGKRWVAFAKGGEYSPYYESLLRVIDWKDDGAEVRRFKGAVIRNPSFYFRGGITYPNIADRFHAKALPVGSIFGHMGPSIFGTNSNALLGFLNSRVAQALLMAQSVTRHFEVGQMRRLCVPPLNSELGQRLATIAAEAMVAAEEYATGDETDRRFESAWLDRTKERSFLAAASASGKRRKEFLMLIERTITISTQLVATEMNFAESDWIQITRALGPELRVDENVKSVGSIKTTIDPLTTAEEHARRFLSFVCRRIVMQRRIIQSSELNAATDSYVRARFTEVSVNEELPLLLGTDMKAWCETQFHLYHANLHKGRPRIVRLSARRGKLRAFIDVVGATQVDLRTFLSEVVDSVQTSATSQMSGSLSAAKRLSVQAEFDDCAEIRSGLNAAIPYWDNDADARARMHLLSPLVAYVKT